MADTTPRLNTSSADPQTGYAPISWMAIAALAIAVLFSSLLLGLVVFAFRSNKPLVEFWLFAFPVLGVVLAFAGRRHILNSEGTRTGLNLATKAWWICIVGGLSYAAYIGATEYTIKSDTEKQFLAWADHVKKVEPGVANDPALAAAFYQTLPPTQRVAFSASATTDMQNRFGADFTTFRQNKLLMMVLRNPGQSELVPQGLKQWQQTPGKIECALAATLRTPEGEFPLTIPMVATVEKGKREWQIAAFDGYVQDAFGAKRTPYGWLVEWLEGTAKAVADQFLQAAAARTNADGFPAILPEGILAQPLAYDTFTASAIPRPVGERIVVTAYERAKITGALGLFWPTSAAYAKGLRGDFFVQTALPDGRMAPDTSRDDFLFCWTNIGFDKIALAGRNLSNSTDKNSMIRFFPDRVEIAVPIELKTLKSDPKGSAAHGRLILILDDPKVLEELSTARTLGLKGDKSAEFPKDLPKSAPWKVARIESDLKVIRSAAGPGAGPGGGQE